ncbi:FAD-binding oxidoreductase [Streptomyces sp. NBC_01498]|uniref:FAD-binding oxidoreductase n=1 Tax=Streptomyces sp. NBC_01498 TaxID=2975870 RepID=UPI002E7B9800|nr:FAD-binding oxidoreductase [Streptomyces sp. NBC_01498]WTL26068.1 FAD-binding oxidoreductase [Streptomyces sp. NBC_01498]
MERRALLAGALAVTTAGVVSACTGGRADGPPGATANKPPASRGTSPASPASPSTTAPAGPPRWGALASGLDGRLVRPGDGAYDTARQLYNTRFDQLKPAAVAYVAGEDDIRECLAFARAHGTPVSIRNGGHSYAGWSSGNGRLVIDISSLDGLGDAASDGVIGAGAKLVDVYGALARKDRTIPGGSCATVGISGLTLGGGHGVVSRAYGLTCDSLVSATLVTADGRRLTADAEHHPDLFWALRGAGNGNFGVVTELRFRTHPAPDGVTAHLNWPWSKARSVVAAWQEWGPDQPDEIWSSLHLAVGAGGGAADPTVSLSAFTLGTESDLRNAVDRLADRAGSPASLVALRPRGYEESMLAFAGCAGLSDEQCRLPGTTPGRGKDGVLRRETYAATSDFYDRSLPSPGIGTLLAAVEDFSRIEVADGAGAGTITLTALGGAINRVDPPATSFVHRGSRMLAQYVASWRPGTPGTRQRAWLRTSQDSLRRYASGAAYQNYTDPDLTDWRTAYYGPAAGRLKTVKERYDPDRLFHFPQAL